jgi:hypothetical protein
MSRVAVGARTNDAALGQKKVSRGSEILFSREQDPSTPNSLLFGEMGGGGRKPAHPAHISGACTR